MGSRRNRDINLPAPYLKRIWIDPSLVQDREAYPFCLPFLHDDFSLHFDRAVTIIVGENGTGKSTIAGGDRACSPDTTRQAAARAMRRSIIPGRWRRWADDCRQALRASWLPKITNGWFFRAESFFSVARYLDQMALEDPMGGGPPPDFLSHSHGEGFLRFFEERCQRQGIFIFDEPESALSPARQIEFLKLMRRMDESRHCQVIMATHSPMLMAYPNATLLRLTKDGLEPVDRRADRSLRAMREFIADPKGFVEAAIEEVDLEERDGGV